MTAVVDRKFGCYFPTATGTYNFSSVEYQVGRMFDWYSAFISFDSTAAAHTELTTAAGISVASCVTTHSSASVATTSSLASIGPGMPVTGTGIPTGATVLTVTPGVGFTISATATADGTVTCLFSQHNIMLAFAPTKTVGLNFSDILAGTYDTFLNTWFTYLGTLPCQVAIRWAWEMNGSYTQYSPLYFGAASSNCTSAAQYIAVWQYVVALQRTNGASNIKWFFCTNAADTPSSGAIPMESFYPGDSYVDIVGYDSYNSLNGVWMTGDQTLAGFTNGSQATAYSRVTALNSTAEVWVGETGCVDLNDPKDISPTVATGHSKADFWTDFFSVTDLPRLTTVNLFDTSGSRNWRFDSSITALNGFVAAFDQAGVPAPAPVTIPGQPPAWIGTSLPLNESHVSGSQESHPAVHNALGHWFNQVVTLVGGWTSLLGNSDGTGQAVRAIISAIGSQFTSILRIEAPAGSKRALSTRTSGSTFDHFAFDMDGKLHWADGTNDVDANLYRSGANALTTDGALTVGTALTVDAAATAASVVSPLVLAANSVSSPSSPAAGAGVTVFSQNDALKFRNNGRINVVRPAQIDLYTGTIAFDPAIASSTVLLTAGVIYLVSLIVGETRAHTKVTLPISVAGGTLANSFAGLYSISGTTATLLNTSADVSTNWQSTNGQVTVPSTSIEAGSTVIAAFVVGSAVTMPTVSKSSGPGNLSLGSGALRFATFGTGQTGLPSTITLTSAVSFAHCMPVQIQ